MAENVRVTRDGTVPLGDVTGAVQAWQDNMLFDSREAAVKYAEDYMFTWPKDYEWFAVWSAGTGTWCVNAKRDDNRREY